MMFQTESLGAIERGHNMKGGFSGMVAFAGGIFVCNTDGLLQLVRLGLDGSLQTQVLFKGMYPLLFVDLLSVPSSTDGSTAVMYLLWGGCTAEVFLGAVFPSDEKFTLHRVAQCRFSAAHIFTAGKILSASYPGPNKKSSVRVILGGGTGSTVLAQFDCTHVVGANSGSSVGRPAQWESSMTVLHSARPIRGEGALRCISSTSSGRFVGLSGDDGIVYLRRTDNLEETAHFTAHKNSVMSIANFDNPSAEGESLWLSVGRDNQLSMCDSSKANAEPTKIADLPSPGHIVLVLPFDATTQLICTGTAHGTLFTVPVTIAGGKGSGASARKQQKSSAPTVGATSTTRVAEESISAMSVVDDSTILVLSRTGSLYRVKVLADDA